MKKLLTAALAAGALAMAAAPALAFDMEGLYFTPKILYSYQKGDLSRGGSDSHSGFGLGLEAGTTLTYLGSLPLRGEVEYVYRNKAKFAKSSYDFDVTAHGFLANVFLDIPTGTNITPYVGGGLGLAYLKTTYDGVGVSTSHNDWNFAWNLGAGAALALTDSIALDLGYRYVDLGRADSGCVSDGKPNADYTAHELSVGLRFSL